MRHRSIRALQRGQSRGRAYALLRFLPVTSSAVGRRCVDSALPCRGTNLFALPKIISLRHLCSLPFSKPSRFESLAGVGGAFSKATPTPSSAYSAFAYPHTHMRRNYLASGSNSSLCLRRYSYLALEVSAASSKRRSALSGKD